MTPTVLNLPSPPATVVGASSVRTILTTYSSNSSSPLQFQTFHLKFPKSTNKRTTFPSLSCHSASNPSLAEISSLPPSPSETEEIGTTPPPPPNKRRYRRGYVGETKGICEEMRFVAMRLRKKPKPSSRLTNNSSESDTDSSDRESEIDDDLIDKTESIDGGESEATTDGETWVPTVEGFANYLVNCKLIFDTIERIVEDSSEVSYVHFRNTGLERSESLSKDLEWLRQQDVQIPEPSKPGISYAEYLKDLSESRPSLFLSHFYNIYFSHIAGGQVITKEVSKRIFEGKKLEFYSWQGNEQVLLKGVRDNLNMLGEHWSRSDKGKCLAETKKTFRYMGQIVRLIIAWS